MKKIALGLTMVLAIAACSRGGGSPSSVVEEFARKMDSGNCTGVKDYLAASSRDMLGPKLEQACQAGTEMRKADPKQKTVRGFRVIEEKIEGERATVRMEADYSDNTKDGGEPIVLVRENGAWKIDLLAGMSAGGGGAGSTPPPAMAPTAPPAATPTPAPAPTATTPAPAPAPDAADAPAEGEADKE